MLEILRGRRESVKQAIKKHWSFLLILVVFFGFLFGNLLSSHMLFEENGNLYSGGSTWGDLAVHLTYISAFNHRGFSVLWKNPLFPGEKFSYHFLSDLISAALVKLGLGLRASLIVPSFLFAVILVILIYFLTFKITKSKIGALLAPFLFFFNGTIFGVYYFWQDFRVSGLGLWKFANSMAKEYAHLADYNIRFANIIADYILPQRPFILGMIIGVLAVYFFWTYWENKNAEIEIPATEWRGAPTECRITLRNFTKMICFYCAKTLAKLLDLCFSLRFATGWLHPRPGGTGYSPGKIKTTFFNGMGKKKLLWGGIVVALLPIVHAQTFITMIMVAGFLFLIQVIGNIKNFKKIILGWIWFAIPIAIIALPQVLLFFPLEKSFLKFQFGWMKGTDSFIWFWTKNLGIYLIIFPIAFIFAKKKLKTFYLAFLGVFIVSNLVLFQPYYYDNMKIMIWWFLLSVILVAAFFKKITEMGWNGRIIIAAIFILLTGTGILSVYRESYAIFLMFSAEDLKVVEFINKNIPEKAVFLTSDKHNHPVPTLTGRQILMGYRGWLWPHGINYSKREKDILTMFRGAKDTKGLLEKYNVSYVVIGPSEIYNFKANVRFFDENYLKIFESQNYKIYEIL